MTGPGRWFERTAKSLRSRTGTEACAAGRRSPAHDVCAEAERRSCRLTELEVRERATVTCLERPDGVTSRKLAAMGLLPGVGLELVQRYPAYAVRVGFAELALDETLASRVRVRRT